MLLAVSLMTSCGGTPNRHPSSLLEDENEYFVENAEQTFVGDSYSGDETTVVGKTALTAESSISRMPMVKMINVYVENSDSMDGYVVNGGDLATLVEDYINQLRHCGINIKNWQYYFINSKIIPISQSSKEFADKVQPTQFKKAGGNRGTSDLADIFDKVVPLSGDTLCLLVSDMIFSPGGKKNADDYIKRQCNRIKEKLLNVGGNVSALLYRFEGRYNGTYYDKQDNRSLFNGVRPFFLCAIGSDEVLQQLRGIEGKLSVPIKNKCIITHHADGVGYAVVPNGNGCYKVVKNNNHAITGAKLSKGKGHTKNYRQPKLTIHIMVDFSKLLCNEQYLLDTSNYITDNAHYRVVNIRKVEHPRFSHILQIETSSNNAANVCISLKNKIPGWIYRFNDNEGLAAKPTDSVQCTYGLKRMVGAMFDAFTSDKSTICDIKISINQK
jgi:hypothetical protein